MTTTIRAKITRCLIRCTCGNPWMVSAGWYDDRYPEFEQDGRVAIRASWPEAMQAAHKLILDLDRELTDEAHESQARRRTARAAQLAAETQPPVIPLIPLAHLHTMEATA